jgi:hypothetical protein
MVAKAFLIMGGEVDEVKLPHGFDYTAHEYLLQTRAYSCYCKNSVKNFPLLKKFLLIVFETALVRASPADYSMACLLHSSAVVNKRSPEGGCPLTNFSVRNAANVSSSLIASRNTSVRPKGKSSVQNARVQKSCGRFPPLK